MCLEQKGKERDCKEGCYNIGNARHAGLSCTARFRHLRVPAVKSQE